MYGGPLSAFVKVSPGELCVKPLDAESVLGGECPGHVCLYPPGHAAIAGHIHIGLQVKMGKSYLFPRVRLMAGLKIFFFEQIDRV